MVQIVQEQAEEAGISKEEYKQWRKSKVTEYVMQQMEIERERWMYFLANGRTIATDAEITTEFVVGRIQGINDFALIEYEDSPEKVKAEKRDSYAY